jgi:hypothetical protein
MLKLIKISGVSTSGKVAYSVSGESFFVPQPLRGKVADNSYGIAIERLFDSKRDETGEVVPCAPWTRSQLSFIGTKQEAIEARNEGTTLTLEANAELTKAATAMNLPADALAEALKAIF